MSTDNWQLSREQLKRFEEGIKESYKEHDGERRRSLEISASFFDKLSTLSAGSIAVSASIALAIVGRSNGAPRTVVHDLLIIAGLLWASLMLAIIHNFLAAQVAKLDASISSFQFQRTLLGLAISLSKEKFATDDATMEQAENLIREQMLPKESKQVKRKEILYPVATWIGYLAMLTFVTAFGLVVFDLHQLW
jgi:hypothetical protein